MALIIASSAKLSLSLVAGIMQRNENEGRRKDAIFDIVSEVDLQEARNGVDNAVREVESRFDFVA
ncbi:putative nucleotide-binding protein [Salmonella enterica subsp. enterica]|uniref:Putative nucleotide-binding protein n=1 Tax=Salmonella enterica I TaxID=59201 RepID=A0A379WEX7_SALET|nr:putative nucleotide-binding protein [Salmonella enterica subsp. enterica]